MTRCAVALAATMTAALVAAGAWVAGQAQYLNDYCTTRASQPDPAAPEALGGRPAYLSGPLTVRCEYDHLPAVEETDPLPLLGAVVLTLVVVALAVVALRWAVTLPPCDGGGHATDAADPDRSDRFRGRGVRARCCGVLGQGPRAG